MVHTKELPPGFQGLSVNLMVLNCLTASFHAPEAGSVPLPCLI